MSSSSTGTAISFSDVLQTPIFEVQPPEIESMFEPQPHERQAVNFNTMSHLPDDERFNMMEVEIPPSLPPDMSEVQPNERPDISQHIRQQNADNKRVGPDLGESSSVKTRKTRSKVWENFDRYQDENGKVRARCKGCGKDFDGSSTLGTTHLRNHFTRCQRKRNGGGGGDNLAGNLSDAIAIKKKPVMDQPSNHLDAARMIIKQGDASRIDSRNKGYIIELYNEEKEKLCNYFKKLSCRLCLTFFKCFDLEEGYSCLMVRFIDDDWKLKNKILKPFGIDETVDIKDIKNVFLEWGIANNLSSMVIDGDVNCDLYKRDDWFSSQGSLLLNNKSLCCEACLPKLEYVVKDELEGILAELVNDRTEPLRLGPVCSNLRGVLKNVSGLKDARYVLADIDPHFKILTKEKWDALMAIYEFYEEWDFFLKQYPRNYNTANIYFPLLCRAYKCCKELRKCHINFDDDDLVEGAWCDYNLVLAVASVLDPRFKMDIVENWYKEIFGDDWKEEYANFNNSFTNIYSRYAREINNFKSYTPGSEETNSSISYKMLDPLAKPSKSSCEPNHVQLLQSDLACYLKEDKFFSFKDFDILEWWRVHARCFPTLARMARDFLSIQMETPFIVLDDEKPLLEELGIEEAYICTNNWLAPEEISSSYYRY